MAFRGNTKVNGSRLILYQLKKDGLLGKFHSRNQTTRVATNQEFGRMTYESSSFYEPIETEYSNMFQTLGQCNKITP